jgi:ribosomal protein S18 acetylase RimI-like enzyme
MHQTTIIQPAIYHDYPQIIRLLQMLAHEEGMMCMLDVTKLKLALECGKPKLEIIVAKQTGKTIGCALFYRGFDVLSASHGSHISDIIVDKSARNQQIGTKLMGAIAQHTANEGGQWLSLTVDKANMRAKNFYLELGTEMINVDFMAMGITNMRLLIEKI